MKRELQSRKVAALKADINRGLADVAAGRIVDFNAERIIERGRKLLEHFHLRYIVDSAVTEPGLGVFGCDLG
jgi:hypothetical protein